MDKILNSDMKAIITAYTNGETLRSLGRKYAVSHEAIRLRLARLGVGFSDKQAMKEQVIDARYIAKTGCSRALLKELRKLGRTGAFRQQRQNAVMRGIVWKLNLGQWWRIWQDSGKWEERGRKRGQYVMSRHGDTGPYSIENVSIQTVSRNCTDARVKAWTEKKDLRK